MFDVSCKSIPRQENFLIDKIILTGRGGNSTISNMHKFYIKTPKHCLRNAELYADNCGVTGDDRVQRKSALQPAISASCS